MPKERDIVILNIKLNEAILKYKVAIAFEKKWKKEAIFSKHYQKYKFWKVLFEHLII